MKWFFREDMDGEQFNLEVVDKDVGHGVPGGVDRFLAELPITGSLDGTTAQLRTALTNAKSAGWRISQEPLDTEW